MEAVFFVMAIGFMIASPLCKGKDWLVCLCLIASVVCMMLTLLCPLFLYNN